MKKRGRENHHSSSSCSTNNHTLILPQILASLANPHTTFAQSLLNKHINHLHKSLNSKTLTLINNNNLFLSLLPLLLRTKSTPSISQRTSEIIGAVALQSFESNQRIASDEEIITALLEVLVSRRKKVSMAACNAVLDISTTSVGRESLCKLNAVEKLMWEGFVHVALYCWNQNKKATLHTPVSPFSGIMNIMNHLLHVAIQQIGAIDPSFAKACMVVSFSSSSNTQEEHQSNILWQSQKTTFNSLISRIDRDALFLEAFKIVELAVQDKNDDMLQRLRWLRHLYQDRKDTNEGFDWDNPLMQFEKIFLLFNEHRKDAEAAFMQAKSQFCREVVFEDVCDSFVILHHKYKKVRTEYMKGMLSLHCNGKFDHK